MTDSNVTIVYENDIVPHADNWGIDKYNGDRTTRKTLGKVILSPEPDNCPENGVITFTSYNSTAKQNMTCKVVLKNKKIQSFQSFRATGKLDSVVKCKDGEIISRKVYDENGDLRGRITKID